MPKASYWKSIAFGGMVLCLYLVLTQRVKRLHDLELRGWWLLLALVPVLSLLLGAGMQFIAGTTGPNKFGADPRRPARLAESVG